MPDTTTELAADPLWADVLKPLLSAVQPASISRAPGIEAPGVDDWASANGIVVTVGRRLSGHFDLALEDGADWERLRRRVALPVGPVLVAFGIPPEDGHAASEVPEWEVVALRRHGVTVLAPLDRVEESPELADLLDAMRDEASGALPSAAVGAPSPDVMPPIAILSDRMEQGEPMPAALATAEAEIAEIREALEAELDALRGRYGKRDAELAETRVRLEKQQAAIDRVRAERQRLIRMLAEARADADAAAAERDAMRHALETGAGGLEASAGVAPAMPSTLPPTPAPMPWPPLPDPERDVQATFAAAYGTCTDSEISLPRAGDTRGVLVDESGHPADLPSVDVVVCVHNALDDLRLCLWSLVHKTSRPFRLIVVNDGSDEPTTRFLEAFAGAEPAVTLVRNPDPPHGYTIAVNLGVRASSADYVVLLNSDTVVTFGWLDRIVARGEAEPETGILGPLSNAASHQSVPELRGEDGWSTNPLPPWLTPDGMALAVRRSGVRAEARLPFINGFCYVVKRAALDAVGEFDERCFASGYCEENDFSQRAREAGFTTAVVDDAYVFHAKSKSFGAATRKVVAKRNYQIFLDKHGRDKIERLVASMEADQALAPVRASVAQATASPGDFAEAIAADPLGALTVMFVLPGLGTGGSGGSHSIYQEVHGLRKLGVPARIALEARAMDRARGAYEDAEDVFVPFADDGELARVTAGAHVISATHNKSVAMLAALVERRRDFLPVYYVQDYEPFFTHEDSADVHEAIASYTTVEGMQLFAKTHWLGNVVAERHGLHVAKVEPSIDHDVYYPDPTPSTAARMRITAMVRPRTPRRQPFSTVQVLERLAAAYPDHVDVRVFGCEDDALLKVTPSPLLLERNRGLLSRRSVADLLRDTDVFVDMSTYQAFGRTALEAMACGATAIVPRIGGAHEFARDGENAIVVDTTDREAAFGAISGLVRNPEHLAALRETARETAAGYSITRAALSEYAVFREAYAQRFGR